MERIGIYGGTFDPVHVGHIQGAEYALRTLELKKLYMIPTCASPHKPVPNGSPSPEQRCEMLKLAAAGLEAVEVSDLELRRGGVSYTFETVAVVRALHPDAELYLLMGEDMFLTVDTWKEPERIYKEVTIAVLCRGAGREDVQQKTDDLKKRHVRVRLLQNPVVPISSTDLRRLLAFDCAGPFLPEGVAEYIAAHGLYRRDLRNLPMAELTDTVIALLNPNRVKHTLGCRDTAAELARLWGADETDAARAGVLHDVTKALPGHLQLTLCREYGILLDEFSSQNPKTLHALTGSLVAERIFGENPAVVAAIKSHTTGKANMNTLEKILYVADYMEPNRSFPGVETLRKLAYTNLNEALQLGLEMTLSMLVEQGREISPGSDQALQYIRTVTGKGKILC